MTTPVTTDDIVQGAVKYLEGFADVLAVLGTYPDTEVPYLFQHVLWQTMEGSESTAVVISRQGGWAGPNAHNTMRFPRLSVEIYVDPQRTAGQVTDPGEAQRRLDQTFNVIDRRLHRSASDTVFWGTVRTLGCLRLGESNSFPVSDGNGLARFQTFYGVIQA